MLVKEAELARVVQQAELARILHYTQLASIVDAECPALEKESRFVGPVQEVPEGEARDRSPGGKESAITIAGALGRES